MNRDVAIKKAVAMLLSAYPASGNIAAETIALYIAVAARQPVSVIDRVVEKFLTGRVPRRNRDYAPSVEAFAAELSAEAKSESEIAEWCRINGHVPPQRRLPQETVSQLSPEQRREMGKKLRALAEALGGDGKPQKRRVAGMP